MTRVCLISILRTLVIIVQTVKKGSAKL